MDEACDRIRREFAERQGRQTVAVLTTLLLVVSCALLYARPMIFRGFSKTVFFGAQVVVIVSFVGYTFHNWRCPACRRHLGGDLYRRACARCGARLQ